MATHIETQWNQQIPNVPPEICEPLLRIARLGYEPSDVKAYYLIALGHSHFMQQSREAITPSTGTIQVKAERSSIEPILIGSESPTPVRKFEESSNEPDSTQSESLPAAANSSEGRPRHQRSPSSSRERQSSSHRQSERRNRAKRRRVISDSDSSLSEYEPSDRDLKSTRSTPASTLEPDPAPDADTQAALEHEDPVRESSPPHVDTRKRKMKLRNPREYHPRLAEEGWWQISEVEFKNTTDDNKRRCSHVGRLVFGGKDAGAVFAVEPCGRCRRKGHECRVYSAAAKAKIGLQAPKSCAYCIKRSGKCDFVAAPAGMEETAMPWGTCFDCLGRDSKVSKLRKRNAFLRAEIDRLRGR